MSIPVFDLHCDTAFVLMGEDFTQYGSLRQNSYHIDLQRASKVPVMAQCFACMGTTLDGPWSKLDPVVFFERQLATIQREVDKNSDLIRLAYSADQVLSNYEKGLMSAVLTLEGPASFGFDAGLLKDLYMIGFRATTLCWNEQNPLTGSHITGGGLTNKGKEFVRIAQDTGMLLDMSHISDEAFYDVMDLAVKPVIATHSNSRTVHNVSRNLTDDMFLQICKIDGVAGFNFYTEFISDRADLDAACDHIFHFLELDPNGDHIALGGDLDGCDSLCGGISGIQDYPRLAEHLKARGLDTDILEKIFWKNALGVMKRCCI